LPDEAPLFHCTFSQDPNGNCISAPEYISRILHWISVQLNDPDTFPPVDLESTLDRSTSITVVGTDLVRENSDVSQRSESSDMSGSGSSMGSMELEEEAARLRVSHYGQNFEEKVQAIMRFIVRIYGHLYHSHAPDFISLGRLATFTTTYVFLRSNTTFYVPLPSVFSPSLVAQASSRT
jgi:hypothetical protein